MSMCPLKTSQSEDFSPCVFEVVAQRPVGSFNCQPEVPDLTCEDS